MSARVSARSRAVQSFEWRLLEESMEEHMKLFELFQNKAIEGTPPTIQRTPVNATSSDMELILLKENNKLCETLYKAFIEPEFSVHGLATEGLDCPWQEELAALDAKMRLFLSGKPLVEELSAVKKAASAASAEVVTVAAEEVPPISQDSSHAAELLQIPEQSRSQSVLEALSVPIPIGTPKSGVALSIGAALVLTCVFIVFLTSSLTIVEIFTLIAKGAGY